MKQRVLMKKRGIGSWNEFKERRFLGWNKPKTKQLFFCAKGVGIWHKGQRKLFAEIGGDGHGKAEKRDRGMEGVSDRGFAENHKRRNRKGR
jgi:hypothetical protein